ncbi:MAG: hypothetical protein A2806_01780 [Candidatus Terrybacteria bacterium RIFCSPHIGHO2_01_FULL_48_17]|uniref:S1 motif domain-containing protein n=1 Tax=Candidatus Terrybacteria bacterium RIFCSPHIGHO2_01_FULL_48_17 TaxID=1802362 RepID=A0A1G2PN83_9BACT|nr:MAG: hypothetical protein A2806_01780 [Candidatus Terrybacteria bacterium RIFCSPHIGHO2_01_FULL_48_17]OHA52661.1 MAG: hypothetical protein A3A30_03515 [Candidatus Terrybacteria bacterium RIFCSPLOWO2_01_FULL_48_14]
MEIPQPTTQLPSSDESSEGLTQLFNEATALLPKIGEIVEGTVVARGTASIFVDLGPRGTGVIFGKEFYAAQEALKDYAIGNMIVAKVVDTENQEGLIELSIAEAGKELAWSHIKETHRNGSIFSTTIKSANRGGLVADVEGTAAFLPASQLGFDHYPHVEGGDKEKILEELRKLIGQQLRVKILDINPKEEKVILSERAAELDELQEELNQFHVGDVVEGNISRIADFGIFVRFGPDEKLEGLVHTSELDWTPVPDFQQHYKVGNKLKVKIIDIQDGRVSLSLKALKPDPWAKIIERFPKNTKVSAAVVRITTFGAFVELAPGVQGLVHIAEYGSEKALQEALEVGKTYDFRMADIDPEARRISLKPWREHEPEKTEQELATSEMKGEEIQQEDAPKKTEENS